MRLHVPCELRRFSCLHFSVDIRFPPRRRDCFEIHRVVAFPALLWFSCGVLLRLDIVEFLPLLPTSYPRVIKGSPIFLIHVPGVHYMIRFFFLFLFVRNDAEPLTSLDLSNVEPFGK